MESSWSVDVDVDGEGEGGGAGGGNRSTTSSPAAIHKLLTDIERHMHSANRREARMERRIKYLEEAIAHLVLLADQDHDAPIHRGVQHHDGTVFAPGTGRLGGTATRELSADATAALAALDDT